MEIHFLKRTLAKEGTVVLEKKIRKPSVCFAVKNECTFPKNFLGVHDRE